MKRIPLRKVKRGQVVQVIWEDHCSSDTTDGWHSPKEIPTAEDNATLGVVLKNTRRAIVLASSFAIRRGRPDLKRDVGHVSLILSPDVKRVYLCQQRKRACSKS